MLIDIANGAQIGSTGTLTSPLVVAGTGGSASSALLLNADASRALITTGIYDPAITDLVSRLAVVDTVSGTQIGAAVNVTGELSKSLRLTADGRRVLITTRSYAVETGMHTTRVAVIDTNRGAQVGTTLILDGEQVDSPRLNADGSRALVTVRSYEPATGNYSTWVIQIDPTTGAQVGIVPFTQDPRDAQYSLISADRTRAVNITSTYPDGTTRVAVLSIQQRV
ncbi:hypothetical protein [Mycobacterium sp. E740]|uniref:hypothetical protein n=1 Tax=Mycobacterium sp. E740 TaxID=1834149 RepID=UPI0012EA2D72|nr:hypothetical protein [Mycobacterium sp. E740]